MLSWLPLLSERTGEGVDDLLALGTAALCRRIAMLQYHYAQGEARRVLALDGGERGKALARLAASDLVTDRIAADLVRRWGA